MQIRIYVPPTVIEYFIDNFKIIHFNYLKGIPVSDTFPWIWTFQFITYNYLLLFRS